MVKVTICNNTEVDFRLLATVYTEYECKESIWAPSVLSAKSGFTGVLGKLGTPEKFGIDSEAFLTLFLIPASNDLVAVPEGGGVPKAGVLAVRVKLRKEMTQTRTMFALAALPSSHLLPPPAWCSGSQKLELVWQYRNRFYRVILDKKGLSRVQVELHGGLDEATNWNVHQSAFQHMSGDPSLGYDEVYENEHKNHTLGHARYSKGALGLVDRAAWTDNDGRRLPRPALIVLPSPCWSWAGDWQVVKIEGVTDEEGWAYAARWGSDRWKSERSFCKFVRKRRWCRYRKEEPVMRDENSSELSLPPPNPALRKSLLRNTDAAVIRRLSDNVSEKIYVEEMPSELENLKFSKYKTLLFKFLKPHISAEVYWELADKIGISSPKTRRMVCTP